MMKDYELLDFHMVIKDVYGSFKILDTIDAVDMPAFYQFSKIVWNYINMKEKLDQEEEFDLDD